MRDRNLWKTVGLTACVPMAAAMAAAQPIAPAKDRPPLSPADILVTGRADPSARDIERQALAITRNDGGERDPLARFYDPVCPGILGLPADTAGLMIDRIRYDAERIGARVDRAAGCRANIIVAFVRDGASEVRRMMTNKGFLFAGLEAAEASEIRNETGPVRAWNNTALHTRHGEADSGQLVRGPLMNDGALNLGPVRVTLVPSSDSRIFLASRIDIEASVIVIDIAAIDRMSIDQIADYAAMRALARTRPPRGDSAAATILSLFDSAGRRPAEMTGFDLAYLRSLYDSGGNLPASARIGGVQRQLRKAQARMPKVSEPPQ
jgi:hypothetical protein